MTKRLIITALFIGSAFIADAYNVWNKKANMPAVARHRTVAFTVGNKGYLGLGHYNSGPNGNIYLEDIWEYDPSMNTWTQKANFAGGPRYHAVGVGYQNVAYVGTGRDLIGSGPSFTLENDWWEFDPIANTWTPKADFIGAPCRGSVAFLIDGFIYVGTGQVSGGYTANFYAYDIANDQWIAGIPPFPGGQRTSAVGFAIDGKGYVGTGGVGCGTTDFYEYKPSANTWLQRADIGTVIRNEACGFSVNGKGYILTGDNCSSGTNYSDMWEYHPESDLWVQLEDFPGAARRYMAAFVIGNKVYCGSGTSGVNYNDLWEYDQTLSTIQRDESYIDVKLYPNPAIENVVINLNNLPKGLSYEDLKVRIVDLQGKIWQEETITSEKTQLSRNHAPSGLYLYHILYEGQSIKQGKFLFQ
ncbi:MAG: T9SS type A sorting domain-containing protein [Crocinitomicaceae bacterium]|nr:T9SS type A sorting domain-containing protein [Crocinitomicaceae bacterium]